MVLSRLKHHLPRMYNAMGRKLVLGGRAYKVQGYHAGRFSGGRLNEHHLMPVFERTLRRPGAFVDIGMNTGQTFGKLLRLDPDREYYGFEPQIECCFTVDQFVRGNHIWNAKIVPVAMSNSDGMLQLFSDSPTDTMASVLPGYADDPSRQRPHSTWVSARRGDEVLREIGIGQVAVVKIDVEGFELEVLEGLSDTLRSQKPTLVFEVLTNWFAGHLMSDQKARARNQERADSIFALLHNLGYKVFQVDDTGNEIAIDRFELDRKPHLENDCRDYVAAIE